SVVGRFLEHSRVLYFRNGGEEEIYLSSADLAPRNINRRVEVMFPVEKPVLRNLIRDKVLAVYLGDNVKARQMNPDGNYTRVQPAQGARVMNSQEWLLKHARRS